MRVIKPALIAYLVVCFIAILLPTSEGYNVWTWKLFVAQIYAIPIFLIVAFISYYVYKKRLN